MVNNIPMRLQKCDFTCIFYGFRTLEDANKIMDWLSNQSKTLTILWWAHVIECRFDMFFVVPNKIFVKNWYKFIYGYVTPIDTIEHHYFLICQKHLHRQNYLESILFWHWANEVSVIHLLNPARPSIVTTAVRMKIVINFGGWANEVEGTEYPKKKYSLVQDMGVNMLATFRLTEVDVIDAD